VVFDFYEHMILKREYERWPEFMRPDYIQHKPILTDGPQGVIDFMEENYGRCKRHEPEILSSFADGDYVMLHVQVNMEPYDRDIAVMDIFRVEDGLLAEHWDVDQSVPVEAKNSNGVF
jgi:predicted SnoaL-like aldol condensation-catalyzing enzyme